MQELKNYGGGTSPLSAIRPMLYRAAQKKVSHYQMINKSY